MSDFVFFIILVVSVNEHIIMTPDIQEESRETPKSEEEVKKELEKE